MIEWKLEFGSGKNIKICFDKTGMWMYSDESSITPIEYAWIGAYMYMKMTGIYLHKRYPDIVPEFPEERYKDCINLVVHSNLEKLVEEYGLDVKKFEKDWKKFNNGFPNVKDMTDKGFNNFMKGIEKKDEEKK